MAADSMKNFFPIYCLYDYSHGHNILRLLILYQIFSSAKVKRNVIISNKHGIYELSHELPNDLRLRILRNQERSELHKIIT